MRGISAAAWRLFHSLHRLQALVYFLCTHVHMHSRIRTNAITTSATGDNVTCRLWQLLKHTERSGRLAAHVLHHQIVSSISSLGCQAESKQTDRDLSGEISVVESLWANTQTRDLQRPEEIWGDLSVQSEEEVDTQWQTEGRRQHAECQMWGRWTDVARQRHFYSSSYNILHWFADNTNVSSFRFCSTS